MSDASRPSKVPAVMLAFWVAKIAATTLGGILTKPNAEGGLNLDRIESSLVLLAVLATCIASTNLRRPATTGAAAHGCRRGYPQAVSMRHITGLVDEASAPSPRARRICGNGLI